jgi:hypothetical protein
MIHPAIRAVTGGNKGYPKKTRGYPKEFSWWRFAAFGRSVTAITRSDAVASADFGRRDNVRSKRGDDRDPRF